MRKALTFALLLLPFCAFAQSISITAPDNRALYQHVNGMANIAVSATAEAVPAGGSVELILDDGKAEEVSAAVSAPYTHTFVGVSLGEHTVDAYILDSSGNVLAHDNRSPVGVGDIVVAVGDSITAGDNDNIFTDNWSADGRTGPYTNPARGWVYGGFEPILADLLTQAKGYPSKVVNAGVPSTKSIDGVSTIGSVIAQNPTARTWLVAYGTNDANQGVSANTYRANLQNITTQIKTAIPDAEIYFPKVFYWTQPVVLQYHDRVGDLIRNNDNCYWGADLDTLFRANHTLYDHLTNQAGTWLDTETVHHPNGVGCQVMALLWKYAIVDKVILVTDGVLPSTGSIWGDKTLVEDANKIGLGSNNLLLVSQRKVKIPPTPPGTVFAGGRWCMKLLLTGATSFTNSGVKITTRAEKDNLSPVGATSWGQLWIALDNQILPTTRWPNATSSSNYNLSAIVPHPGQLTTVVDTIPPVTTCQALITLASADSTGLPVTIRYKWDSGVEQVYSGPFPAISGTHTLYYWGVDQSGNAESKKSMIMTGG
ncbi:MAG: SGNH/GDSL hydrolase family protein [Armatimonadota bacterium]